MDETNGQPQSATGSQNTTRTYVACNSCRARKVKCMLTDLPPCAKCKREHRECIFDTQRKKAKHRNPPRWTRDESMQRMRHHSIPDISGGATGSERSSANDQDSVTTPRDQVRNMPPPMQTVRAQYPEVSPSGSVPSISERLMSTVVAGSADALETLSHAAQNTDVRGQARMQNTNESIRATRSLNGMGLSMSCLSEADDTVLDVWDKCRFVRQGWFTAQEAVTFIDLFFLYFAPLSAIDLSQFQKHSDHAALVYDEPMLCCALLAISSRVFILPGAGAITRSHNIHQRLWQYYELLLKRVVLGQEKHSSAKTRTVGTIESFLLLSDWHPRAIHLPPETEGWDAFLISPAYERVNRRRQGDEASVIRWREDVFEPVKRADRMSWMLLGLATNLGIELGVLGNPTEDSSLPAAERHRRMRAGQLLTSYVTQTAVRLGYQTFLPSVTTIPHTAGRLREESTSEHHGWQAYMNMWKELIQLAKAARATFFYPSTQSKTKVLDNQYMVLLEHFENSLTRWYADLVTQSERVPTPLRQLLLLEYYHLRAFNGSVAVQAVVERSSPGTVGTSTGQGTSFASFATDFDAKTIRGVISDCQAGLEIASSAPFTGSLPYTPTRTRILIISMSVFLLKATVIGGQDVNIPAVARTLDRCQDALKSNCLDDIDFASQYAHLIRKYAIQLEAGFHANGLDCVNEATNAAATMQANLAEQNTGQDADTSFYNGIGASQGFAATESDMNMANDVPLWAVDPNVNLLDSGWDNVAFGFEADSLDFLWGYSEQDPQYPADNLTGL